MEYATLSPADITAIARETVNLLEAKLFNKLTDRQRIMKRRYASPNTIEKYGLMDGVGTRQTVVNMINRGDFGAEGDGWFKDMKGNYQVLTATIRRHNEG